MILPYHAIATAAAFAEVSVCATHVPAAKAPGEDRPLFLSACGVASPFYQPSRWMRVLNAVLAPISGPSIARPHNGANNI